MNAEDMLKNITNRRVPSFNSQWQGRVERLSSILALHPNATIKVYSNGGSCKALHSKTNMALIGGSNSKRSAKIGYQLWAIW